MSHPGPSDEDLIRTFRSQGDRAALECLVSRHWGRVRRTVFAMLLNHADADDLTQEVFVRAIRGLSRFRGDARFSTWLCRITMNTVRTFLAKDTRPAPASDDRLAEQVDRRVSPPEELAAASELDGQITAAMATLSPGLRAAIVLTAVNGFSVGDAARTEGCSVPTMYWRVHKARKILRKRLAGYLSDMREDAENCRENGG